MDRKIHIIVNPASGRPKPILHIVNKVCNRLGVDWDISITRKRGDVCRFAREAVSSGVDVVAVYGGDGSVMEAAQGLIDSSVPLAILPGGSANLMSIELGIPKDLEQAVEVAADKKSIPHVIDMGRIREDYFILRVGIGFGARKVAYADRSLKNRIGALAYSVAAIKALKESHFVHYRITVDDQTYEAMGVTCLIDNAGTMGVKDVKPVKDIRIDDGLLDVLILGPQLQPGEPEAQAGRIDAFKRELSIQHWQAKQITVEADPPQPVTVDGEMVEDTPLTASILPGVLKVLVPNIPVTVSTIRKPGE
jgi:diacylglycerol kinase (ATP)